MFNNDNEPLFWPRVTFKVAAETWLFKEDIGEGPALEQLILAVIFIRLLPAKDTTSFILAKKEMTPGSLTS
jgi:hypothetical protein